MPTSASVPQEPHHARGLAGSFGADAARYDRARPRYPDALIERIVGDSHRPEVLDVGCGTGIVARQLQAAGCRVLGVEPDDRMAEFARGSGVEVEVAKLKDWDSAGRTFGAVVAGQTWHWIDPVAGATKAAEVLRPGGLLAVFWNVPQFPPDLGEAISAVYRQALPDLPYMHNVGTGPAGFARFLPPMTDGIKAFGFFEDPVEWRFGWQRAYTKEEWLDAVPTEAGHDRFPPEKLRELVAGIGAAIDAEGGQFTMTFTTVAVAAGRIRQ